nr:hypothetical protein [Tanacetum cinerariifolium]
DKIILDTYGDTLTLKRRRDDNTDKDEEPFARSDRGSKRRREGKEPESASVLKEKDTRSAGADDQPIEEPSQHPEWFSQQTKPPNLDQNEEFLKTIDENMHNIIKEQVKEQVKATSLSSAEEETREEEEESFDPIPRTPEDSEDDGNGEEDQGLRVSEEQRLIKEEEADELYRDVDINQGRGLQVSQDIEDSHVTLTPVQPDGQQESSSVSSFVTSILNPISDAGVESIFTTASSSVDPLPTPIPIMTPSIITTITTASHPPIPPTPIPKEQRNLYKALVDAYEADKTILESYRETAILKRICEDADDQEGPSIGSDRGSKRRREGGEPESASTPSKPATRSASNELAKQADSRSSFNELLDTPIDFSNFIMNRLDVDTLTPELLAGP